MNGVFVHTASLEAAPAALIQPSRPLYSSPHLYHAIVTALPKLSAFLAASCHLAPLASGILCT